MKILALDLATRTGWALSARGRIRSGARDFDGESHGQKFLKLRAWLDGLVPPHRVVVEQAHHRGRGPTELAIGFLTVVKMWCAANKIELGSVHSSTLKVCATGDGQASKADMVRRANVKFRKKLGRKITDHNEADALHLLEWARNEFAKEGRD